MKNTLDTRSEPTAISPYSARRMAKPVNFYCHARPEVKSVNLVGDFNDWGRTLLPMRRQPDGWWFIQVPLTHGHHQYLFLVDGKPELDPHAAGTASIEAFGKASVMAVS